MSGPDPHAGDGVAFPKGARLRLDRDFAAVRTRSRRHLGHEAIVRVVATEHGRPRLGLATPRAYGNAVRRNRFRRVARAAFRAVMASLGSRDFLLQPRRDLREPTLRGLARDLSTAAGAPPP